MIRELRMEKRESELFRDTGLSDTRGQNDENIDAGPTHPV
jgi:hypothetical protein